MGDYQSSDKNSQYSNQESSDGYSYGEPDSKLVAGTAKGPTIKVITKETLSTAQEEDLSTIMDLLLVEKHQARRLLIFHRWDKEKLARKFVEKGKTSLFAEAGVSEKERHDLGSSVSSSMTCEICFEVVPCNETTRMDCGHCFCNKCWIKHFIVKIYEGQSKHIKCMAHKCEYYCNEDVVRTLLREENCDMAEKFERFLLESYIEDNRRAKWCPSTPHCGNAIRVEDDDVLYEVECSCGFQFCLNCLSEPHSPCSCLMSERWTERFTGANWLRYHTQPCPKCDRLVYKSEGCNWVTCICGPAFRWQAGGRKEKAEEVTRDESRFVRYHEAHKNCLEKGFRLTESIGKKASFLRDSFWVNDGLSTLVRSWRVLSYSYPFAFYLFEDGMLDMETITKHNLFEYHQEKLQENVEKLSKILKQLFESDKDKVSDIKMQVINLSAVIDNFCEHVYEFIEDDLLRSFPHRIAPYKLLKPGPEKQ